MKYLIIYFMVLVFSNFKAFSQDSKVEREKQFNVDKYSVAIQGYDPVAYFTGKPQKGQSSLYYFYKGIRYEFANAENLNAFKLSPQKYEPQYGGWCAYAMGATGEKVEVDPLYFKVTDGKLYLFYYSIINNTLNKWNQNPAALKTKADANWQILINKK